MSFHRDMAAQQQPPPVFAQLARAFALLQAWPGPLAAVAVFLRAVYVGDVGWVAVLVLVVALGYSALAVASFIGLGSRARWAWWTAIATFVLNVLLWLALLVLSLIMSAQIDGVDGGMVFASVLMLGVPMIALAGAGLVLLVLAPVPRFFRSGSGSDSAGLGS